MGSNSPSSEQLNHESEETRISGIINCSGEIVKSFCKYHCLLSFHHQKRSNEWFAIGGNSGKSIGTTYYVGPGSDTDKNYGNQE